MGMITLMTSGYDAALARLPDAYATALRLADAGLTADEVAATLGVEPESLPPLLELAHRKLRRELTRPQEKRRSLN